MSVIAKHNRKTWTNSERVITHSYDDQFYLEIHHHDKKHQQLFISGESLGINTSNAVKGYWLNWKDYRSKDKTKFYLTYPITIGADGEYWIEVLYHNTMDGTYPIQWNMNGNNEEVAFRGSDNFLNRHTKRYHLQKGEHEFKLTVDPHLCILGVIVKKIDTYGADHKLSRKNKLTCISATHTESEKVGADEFSFEILYDNDWHDPESLTDFLFDFRDEVNFSVMNSDGVLEQIFGGYVSSCSLNGDETILTIKCAGRLTDGDKRYVVEELNVGGDASILTDEHRAEDIQRFDDYNGAIDYLFSNYETILQSNMAEVFKEKAYESIDINIMDKSEFNKCKLLNMSASLESDGIYLRNGSGTNHNQTFILYDSDWYNSDPICIDDFPIFYMTYGMGAPAVSVENNASETVSTGVSSDGGVITVRGKPSCGCCAGTPYQWYTKHWKNYCPVCKRSGSLTDNPKGVPEHEITCGDGHAPWGDGCDADFCVYCGGDKWGAGRCKKTKLVSASVSESDNSGNTTKSDQNKMTNSLSDVFKIVSQEVFKYRFLREDCSSSECMQRKGYGDSWAFSELMFERLKQAGVGCKIVQYEYNGDPQHRSVLVKNTNGKFEDFPYAKYGFNSRYKGNLGNNSRSLNASVIQSYDGRGAGESATGKGTTSNGFDKDKMFMAWIRVQYSTSADKNATRESFYIDFTGHQSDKERTFRGFTPISLNNIFTTGSVSVVNKVLAQPSNEHIYLRSIALEYRVLDEPLWENKDGTSDNSSYRMILKNIGFRSGKELNPIDLGATGKSLNEVLGTVVENGKLHLRMYPAQYRSDDRVVVKSKRETDPKFTCLEGKGGNILDISNWGFNPISDYINRSLVVFKSQDLEDETSLYNYLGCRNASDVMTYGEISDIISISDDISAQEAYYESVANPKFVQDVGSSMTVTVLGCPADVKVGDYVEVVLEDGHYTDWKEVKSISHVYNVNQSPKLQTKLGLNRPEKVVELKDEFEAQRRLTKSKKAVFGKTATYSDSEVFKWED